MLIYEITVSSPKIWGLPFFPGLSNLIKRLEIKAER